MILKFVGVPNIWNLTVEDSNITTTLNQNKGWIVELEIPILPHIHSQKNFKSSQRFPRQTPPR
jgi:hypothetical protein